MSEPERCGQCELVQYFETQGGDDYAVCMKAGCQIRHSEYNKKRPVWCPKRVDELQAKVDHGD